MELDKQRLFDHMATAHNLTLTDAEMEGIIAACRGERIPSDMALVYKDQLIKWSDAIDKHNAFRADVAQDIGWIAEVIYKLKNGNTMALVSKLLIGQIKPAELGFDIPRLEAIAQKYAPQTFERLKQQGS